MSVLLSQLQSTAIFHFRRLPRIRPGFHQENYGRDLAVTTGNHQGRPTRDGGRHINARETPPVLWATYLAMKTTLAGTQQALDDTRVALGRSCTEPLIRIETQTSPKTVQLPVH